MAFILIQICPASGSDGPTLKPLTDDEESSV
jgi:hypothetical protein